MKNSEKALETFNNKFNCAQSVFCTYAEKFGIDDKQAKLISAGFGGGIGRTQDICGALTGGIMAIGCKYFDASDPENSKVIVYEKTRELIEKFKELNEHIDCLDLTGASLLTEEGQKKFLEQKIHETKCTKYVSDVCKLLDEMI